MSVRCAGLFAPCDNPPDPEYTVEDPDGREPPVLLCAECGRKSAVFFEAVFSSERLTRELEFAVEAARTANSAGGIS